MTDQERLFDLSCVEAQENLSAMLDGEIGLGEEAAVRRHIETCQSCESYERDLLSLQSKVSDLPHRPGDGAAAWARAKAQIELQAKGQSGGITGSAWRSPIRLAAAATIALAVTVGGWQALAPQAPKNTIIAETARDFQVFQASGEILDIAATHPDAVLTWMTARLDFMLPGKLQAPDGVTIAGGRLCSLLGRKLAFIAYTVDDQDVGLYVARAKGLNLPADGSVRVLELENGLSTIGWRTGDLAYVVVSNLPVPELTEFSAFFQRASRES